jgi:hypothetical protein
MNECVCVRTYTTVRKRLIALRKYVYYTHTTILSMLTDVCNTYNYT